MRRVAFALALVALMTVAGSGQAQQVADTTGDLSVAQPRWTAGSGPRVAIDAGHQNFHTIDGRYAPFATVLRGDGLRVAGRDGPLTAGSLANADVLVISNALDERNTEDWTLPTPSAFTAEEIAAVRAWVEAGGALLLIADHMPFGGSTEALARAFGVHFDNSFALLEGPEVFSRANGRMQDSPVTEGLTEVRSFTGSSFQAPPDAVVPLRLDSAFTIVMPQQAWQFDGQPRRPATAADARLALLTIGKGRVAVSGEAAMFTAQVSGPNGQNRTGLNADGAQQNKALLLNLMRWLAGA